MKRFLSILLAVMMIMSTVSVVSVGAAEGDLEITYWNADSTKITLDFNAEVDADELEEAITLTLGGDDVEFTVEKKTLTTTATVAADEQRDIATYPAKYLMPLTAETDYTYEIIPAGGMELGSTYFLAISGDFMGGVAWTKGIKVNKLWKETFNGYTDFATSPWLGTNGSYELISDGNDGKALKISLNNKTNGVIQPSVKFYSDAIVKESQDDDTKRNAVFADTGVASKTYWADGSAARKMRDYNIELEFKADLNSYTNRHGIQISMHNNGHTDTTYGGAQLTAGAGYSASSKIGPALSQSSLLFVNGADTPADYGYRMYAGAANLHAYTYNAVHGYETNGGIDRLDSNQAAAYNYRYTDIAGSVYSNSSNDSVIVDSDLSDADATNDVTHKIAMSEKGNNLKFSIESSSKKGYTSYDFTDNLSEANLGLPYIYFIGCYGVTHSYVVDNIIATKAEEVVPVSGTVVYWNADSSKITLDLTSSPSAEALAECIQVKKNGEAVTNFTVEKKNTVTGTLPEDKVTDIETTPRRYVMPLVSETDSTYEIYPQGGIEIGAIYTVILTPDTGAAWSKHFKVNKLWEEDFDDYTDVASMPWVYSRGDSAMTLETDSAGGKYLRLSQPNGDGLIGPSFYSERQDPVGKTNETETKQNAIFADTGVASKDYWAAGSEARKQKDYNIEIDVTIGKDMKFENGAWVTGHSTYGMLGISVFMVGSTAAAPHNQIPYFGAAAIQAGADKVPKTKAGSYLTASTVNMMGYGDGKNGYQVNGANLADSNVDYWGTTQNYFGQQITTSRNDADAPFVISNLTDNDTSNDVVNKLSMSVKESNLKFGMRSVNGVKDSYESYDFTDNRPEVGLGLPMIRVSAYNIVHFHIDNIKATRAVEVEPNVYWGDMTITSGGSPVENLATVETIDVAIDVTNIVVDLPCKAIIAIYDSATNFMKNVAISPVTNISLGSSQITFTNVNTNGGDTARVFFWDGLNTLVPYRNSIDFPAAE